MNGSGKRLGISGIVADTFKEGFILVIGKQKIFFFFFCCQVKFLKILSRGNIVYQREDARIVKERGTFTNIDAAAVFFIGEQK